MRKLSLTLLAAAICVLGVVAVAQATVSAHAVAKHRKTVKHPTVHGLRAPGLLTPANGANVQQLPTLTWSAVAGAVEYEYELAADPRFHSIVLGTGTGRGNAITHNLGASLEKPLADGTYYWRVRGLSAKNMHGGWSTTRTITKRWTESPQLLGPETGARISWPATPLALRWKPVPNATEYIVTIATDPQLSHLVLGTSASPQKTSATAFAVPGSVHVGPTYYWAITPLDVLGHRGQTSEVKSFSLTWPSAMATSVTPLNALSGETELNWTPELSWTPVTGAAGYEVEVSSAEGYPAGSIWSQDITIGTVSYSPPQPLNNNEYYWRVRAVAGNGSAGQWNEGPRFRKGFDNTTPTIPRLAMSDVAGNTLPPGAATETPIVTWEQVPGAGKYEVQVAPYEGGGAYCNWSAKRTYETATLGWTPLSPAHPVGQKNWPAAQSDSNALEAGESYCVQVAAISDKDLFGNLIESVPTQLGGPGQPAFTFVGVKPAPGPAVPLTPSSAYLLPAKGSTAVRTPIFTWSPVAGARSYDVVIARDKNFTNVVDVGSTEVTAYAPRIDNGEPLNDEQYYWAVVPVNEEGKIGSSVLENAPQAFNKSSVPPVPISAREEGAALAFKWTPAEGAVNYTLQISDDSSFANVIETKPTSSTAYTSSAAYPAYGTLYWRVRANDASKETAHAGLNWSATQEFTRTLPLTAPLASNPYENEEIPLLSWQSVSGAVGYRVLIENSDGTKNEFTTESTAFTRTQWDGPGVWRWQAAALFPKGGEALNAGTLASSPVAGGYFAPQSLSHTLAPPARATGTKAGSRITISWNPESYAKEYEVAISTSETFNSKVESHRTGQTSWAPNIDLSKRANKGTLYWRVAAVDNKDNVGAYSTGRFVPPKPKCVVKKVKKKVKGKTKTVNVCVVAKHKPAKKTAKKHK